MIDDDSPAGSWRDAMLFRKHMYLGRDDEEAAPAESSDEVEVLMEKCRQWKRSTEMLCAIRSDHITLGDLYRAGIWVSLSIDE